MSAVDRPNLRRLAGVGWGTKDSEKYSETRRSLDNAEKQGVSNAFLCSLVTFYCHNDLHLRPEPARMCTSVLENENH